MTLTIQNTTLIVHLDGIPCRVWEGHTDKGIRVHCYIPRLAVELDEDQSDFERELEEQRTPSAEVAALPLRMIL